MFRKWLCLLVVSTLSGCASDVVNHPGGLPGIFAGYFFPAKNPEIRLLRAYTFMAAAAQVGATKYARNPAKLEDFLGDFKRASVELNAASQCMSQEYCAFETVMRGYYHRFNSVAENLVSKDEWKQIASFSNPLDFYEKPAALKTILSNGIAAGGDIAAVYRDALNLRMDIAIESLHESDPLRKELVAVRDAPEPDYGRWNQTIKKVKRLKPKPKHYEAVMSLVRVTCKRLVSAGYRPANNADSEAVYSECFGNSTEFFKVYEAVYKPGEEDTIKVGEPADQDI